MLSPKQWAIVQREYLKINVYTKSGYGPQILEYERIQPVFSCASLKLLFESAS